MQWKDVPDKVPGLWSQLSYTKVTNVDGWILLGRNDLLFLSYAYSAKYASTLLTSS